MEILKLSDEGIVNVVTPIALQMEEAWNNNNYDKFLEHVSLESRNKIDHASFISQRDEAIPELGKNTLKEIVTLHKNPDNVIVIWKVKFEKREETGLRIMFFKENNGRVVVDSSTCHPWGLS